MTGILLLLMKRMNRVLKKFSAIIEREKDDFISFEEYAKRRGITLP